MEGSEVGTTDGETQTRWTLGSAQNTQHTGLRRVAAHADRRSETLRARLIVATVEVLTHASNPRLGRTRYMRTAP
jgi:hypothetical protein